MNKMKNKIYYNYLFISIAIILTFSSCNKDGVPKKSADIVIYPTPPDTARIQYLTSISDSKIITGKRNAFLRFVLGDFQPLPIMKPYGIAIRKGKVYICDTGIGGIEIINLDKKTFTAFVPKGKGMLKLPLNCFVDENDYLYVADGNRRQIVIFDNKGEYVNAFGEAENFKPTDVVVYNDKIFVANSKGNKINVYKKGTFELLTTFPESGEGSEDFLYSPVNICVTSDKVFVSDIGDSKIKKYTHEGKFINAVGSNGKNIGQFVRPKGIAVDKEENLFVIDAAFENAQIFDKQDRLLLYFGGPYKAPGDMWLPAKIIVDYDNLKYFQKYVDPSYELKYLIFVTNQYGPDKVSVYGSIGPKK